jgi:hypothetical protein
LRVSENWVLRKNLAYKLRGNRGENWARSCMFCTSDQIKKNEMGSACGTYGNRKVVYRDLVEETDGKRQLEDLDLDWGMILKFVFKK